MELDSSVMTYEDIVNPGGDTPPGNQKCGSMLEKMKRFQASGVQNVRFLIKARGTERDFRKAIHGFNTLIAEAESILSGPC